MKQKRKHLLKKFLIFGIAFLLASCSEELFDEAIESSNKASIKEVRFNELYKDSKFKNLLEKVSHTSNAARTSFENQNGFTISDGFVKVIETDSVISYTMLIERDIVTDTISFENLVIHENKFNASQKAYSIKYTPTIIKASGHDSFYYEGTEELKSLAFTGFNRVGENAIETSNCYVNVVQVWCSQPYNGQTKHHIAGANCSPSTQYYKIVSIISSDCEGNGSSSGSSGSNNTNPPQGPTGPGNTGGGITSPVKPNQGFGGNNLVITPCNDLLAKDQDSIFNAKMIELKLKAANQGYESAYVMNQNAGEGLIIGSELTGNPNGPLKGREIRLDFGSTYESSPFNCIGVLHCHLDNGTTYKVFSFSDILALGYIATVSTRPKEEFAIYVTTSSGTFAIKINDKMKLKNSFEYLNMMRNYYETSFEKLVDIKDSVEKQKLGLVKFITDLSGVGGSNTGINDIGIDMYEKDNTGKWNKLSLSSNGNSIVNKPCK